MNCSSRCSSVKWIAQHRSSLPEVSRLWCSSKIKAAVDHWFDRVGKMLNNWTYPLCVIRLNTNIKRTIEHSMTCTAASEFPLTINSTRWMPSKKGQRRSESISLSLLRRLFNWLWSCFQRETERELLQLSAPFFSVHDQYIREDDEIDLPIYRTRRAMIVIFWYEAWERE